MSAGFARKLLLVSITAFLGHLAMAADAPAMKVWAIGDYYRINPLTSKAFEDNPLLFPECLTGDYKQSNLVWDGASNKISLKAARNEIVAFQIVVERVGDAKLSDVQVKLADFTGPSGKRIPTENVDLYKEWYVNISKQSNQSYSLGKGWYPDGLIPCLRWSGNLFPASYVMPFDIPDVLNNISLKQKSQALWVDVYVPKEREKAPPGTYKAAITVSSNGGQAILNAELAVWDFMLPDESHLKGNIHNDTDLNTLLPEIETKYYQMIRRHRLAMGTLGYAPVLEVSGTNVRFDWSKYDARLSRYLDGSAFTEKYGYSGPGYGIPAELLILPFDAYADNPYYDTRHVGFPYGKEWKFYKPWPVRLPKEGPTPEYREIWKKTFKGFEDHLDQNGWTKTRPVVFLLSLDESYDAVSIDRMLMYGELMKEAGVKRLQYRVDGWYPPEAMKRLSKVVNIVILGLPEFFPDRVGELKQAGVDPWFYTGVGWTDGDPLQCRALSWLAWKYGAGSWTIWESDFNSLRAYMYPETYPGSNGTGFLIYRGETMGLDEPVASIRLKQLRRGSQDYEYFWLLSQRGTQKEAADKAVAAIIHDFVGKQGAMGSPGMWNHNPEEWEKTRMKLGDLIERSR